MSRDAILLILVALVLLIGGPSLAWWSSTRDARESLAEARATGAALGARRGGAACGSKSHERASAARHMTEDERRLLLEFTDACFEAAERGEWCELHCGGEYTVEMDCEPGALHAGMLCRDIWEITQRHCCVD